MYKATGIDANGVEVVQFLHQKIQADAFQSVGFDIEEVDESEMPLPKKTGRPKKEEE